MDLKGLFKSIAAWAFERDMEKTETKSTEHELPEGKSIDYEVYYTKRMTDYTILVFKVKILCHQVKKVEVVKEKKKAKMDQGTILVTLDSFLQSDSENKWDDRPFLVFVRTLFEKYIYKTFTNNFERQITKFTHELYALIEKFLNIYSHPNMVEKVPYF